MDSRLITLPSSLHPLTEMHVGNRQSKERDRNGYPNNILHLYPLVIPSAAVVRAANDDAVEGPLSAKLKQ